MLLGKYLIFATIGVKEEVIWAFKSPTLSRRNGHDILPEEMGVERAAFHSHS